MFFSHLKGPLEALLFVGGDPVPAARLASILEVNEEHIYMMVAEMQESMAADDRGLTIVEIAGGYQLCTKPSLSSLIEKMAEVQDRRLSAAAMETLAIIAFKQPVTRQEIESIRGIKADRIVHNLLERRLIKEVGRKDTTGRPILYATTGEFLSCFGLKSLEDLPSLAEFLPIDTEETSP